MKIERERKYLLRSFAARHFRNVLRDKITSIFSIDQAYVSRQNDIEVRVRRSINHADLSITASIDFKEGTGETRREWSNALDEKYAFAVMKYYPSVTKVRFTIDGWEIDEFVGPLGGERPFLGLVLAEFELASSTSDFPKIPEWLEKFVIKEVTDDPDFKNKNLVDVKRIEWKDHMPILVKG